MSVTTDGTTRRGTSNGNERGNVEDRRRRRQWLVETYRANQDLQIVQVDLAGVIIDMPHGVWHGNGEMACRCYRCGALLTVDRIIPGCKGGTYRRNNIRPACSGCNSETGGALSGKARR